MLYGICFWLLNKNKDNILLDNSGIEMFEALNPQGKLFTILEDLSTYYKISYGDKVFIIRKEAMKVIEGSFLEIGTLVSVVASGKQAIIKDRYWHFKDSKPFYILLGSSRRFFEKELLYEERNINM